MKKSNLLLACAAVTLGVTSAQARNRAPKNPCQPVAPMQEMVQPEQPQLSLEQQHMVIPFDRRQSAAKKAHCQQIQNSVAEQMKQLVENSEGNLTIAAPNSMNAPLIAEFQDPETQQLVYVYYTPEKPIRIMDNNKEEYVLKTQRVFESLAKNYNPCGFLLEPFQGNEPPKNKSWLAWFKDPYAKKGAIATINMNYKPTEAQVVEYEKTMKEQSVN